MRGFAPWPGAYTEFRGQTWHLRGGLWAARRPGAGDNFGGEGFGESGLWRE